jgi:cytoskeletal protein CcmA (bactofilin family)
MAMLGKKEEGPGVVQTINPQDATTILGRDAKFEGKLVFEGVVRIDGHFDGEIITDDLLVVGPNAEIKAAINVGSVVINGYVEGDVIAKSSVEIKAPGKLRGNVTTPTLVIEKGVTFDGSCRMSDRGDRSASSTPLRPPMPKPIMKPPVD